jgi:hypothetical protein
VRVASVDLAFARAAEVVLGPFDRVRRGVLRALSPWVWPLYVRRDARVGVMGLAGVLVALVTVVSAPLWCLLWAPLLLGVPHLAADVRYLVVRQGLHRRAGFWLAVVLPVALAWVWPRAPLALAALVGAAFVARTSRARRLVLALPASLALVGVAWWEPRASLILAHAHNVVAVAFWWYWARGHGRWRHAVVAGVLAAVLAIGLGVFDGLALRPWALQPPVAGFDLGAVVNELSPVSPWLHPVGAVRWALAFALLQSVHYAMWLRLIPDEDRARTGPRGFVGSYRALAADLGHPAVWLVGAVALGALAWGLSDAATARMTYLRLAFGHGYLELAVAALLVLEGRRLRADDQPEAV